MLDNNTVYLKNIIWTYCTCMYYVSEINEYYYYIIVLDFSNVFDKVDHNKLIYKLSALGVHPLATRWINSFLQCRTQKYK